MQKCAAGHPGAGNSSDHRKVVGSRRWTESNVIGLCDHSDCLPHHSCSLPADTAMRALWEGRCECDPGMWSPVGRGASAAWQLKIEKIDSCRRSFPRCIRFLMLSSTFFMVGLMGSLSFVLYHRGALPMDTSHAQQPVPPHRPAWLEPLQPHTMSDEDLFAQVLHLPTVDRLQERHQEKVRRLLIHLFDVYYVGRRVV